MFSSLAKAALVIAMLSASCLAKRPAPKVSPNRLVHICVSCECLVKDQERNCDPKACVKVDMSKHEDEWCQIACQAVAARAIRKGRQRFTTQE